MTTPAENSKMRKITMTIGKNTDVNVELKKHFAPDDKDGKNPDFPLQVKVSNKAMFDVILPNHFHLKPLHDTENGAKTVKIHNYETLLRVVSDLQGIASLHNKEVLAIIEAEVLDDSEPAKDGEKTPPNEPKGK